MEKEEKRKGTNFKNMNITIQGKVVNYSSDEDKSKIELKAQKFPSFERYSFKRLLEGESREDIKKIGEMFSLNTRYADDAIMKAKAIVKRLEEDGWSRNDMRRVIFGGRKLFEEMTKKAKSDRKGYKKLRAQWEERRKFREKKIRQGNLGDQAQDPYPGQENS